MDIDFLREGSADCPIIRLYNGEYEDYNKLITALNNLINSGIPFDVLKIEGFKHNLTINSMIIEIDKENRGVIEKQEASFHCYWSKYLLSNIIERLKIYQKNPNGYFWLDDAAENIDVLLSYSGRW